MSKSDSISSVQDAVKKNKLPDPMVVAKANPKSFRKAVNAKCFDCVGFSRREVTLCAMTDCPLYQLRPWQKKSKVDE